ncbi:MAG: endonuclease [Bacteroidota bacterium]
MRDVFHALLFVALVPAASAQSIAPGLTGTDLLRALEDTYGPATVASSAASKDALYSVVDVETRAGEDGVAGVYTDWFVAFDCSPSCDPSQDVFNGGSGINQEHVWPRSQGTGSGLAERDMHHLFPSRVDVNSDRGSLPFGDSNDAQTQTWYYLDQSTSTDPPLATRALWSERIVNTVFEPREDRKGDIARALFYVYTMYGPEGTDQVSTAFFTAMQDTLLAWHRADPATADDVVRSERVAAYHTTSSGTDAINPFVVDSSLAARAFVDAPSLTLTLLLQGAYMPGTPGTMRTDLSAVLPETDPMLGIRVVSSGYFTADATGLRVVDWVLLRFRDASPTGTVVAETAALLLEDGSVVDLDGGAVPVPTTGSRYVSVNHRNHEEITTAVPLVFSPGGTVGYDFSTDASQAHGSNAQASTSDGRAALWAGDATGDGLVTAPDFNVYSASSAAGETGYRAADFTLDGLVTAPDFNLYIASSSAGR